VAGDRGKKALNGEGVIPQVLIVDEKQVSLKNNNGDVKE